MVFNTFAELPTTIDHSGKLLVTTEQLPTIVPSPISTPGNIVVFKPI